MNKNTIKKLADNPHYAMNDKELEALANMLREEAEAQKDEGQDQKVKYVNKNRVHKTKVKLDKTPILEEEDNDSTE